ncbi:MAG: hypothetical protein M1831_000192 [Alyxoria varia]|nr:MAG: hypothetical protein M1831_000192 [Alyxoria varia]
MPTSRVLYAALLSACVTLAAAAGTTKANFEDVPAVPVVPGFLGVNQLPRPYKGLCYDNLGLANQTLTLGGILPRSSPNDVLNSPQSLGVAKVSVGADNCPGTGRSFTLKSFYVGCEVVTGQSVADAPKPCSLTIKATAPGGGTSGSTVFNYEPQNLQGLLAPMQKVDLSRVKGFQNVKSVEIQRPGLIQGLTTVLAADDFEYVLN